MIAEPTNRLAEETSPYLLLHATNPVDWYPWGREAFEAARRQDKPILLSVGYSTCYWCHVMERESFADAATAAVLNDAFVCIKVDREERPDLDEQYMQAVQLLTGSGGWPMTVMLTHDLKPFYGGTYYPPDQLRRVVAALSDVWRNDRARLLASADELAAAMARGGRPAAGDGDLLSADDVASALDLMLAEQDSLHGGQRGAPKFPQDMADALFVSAWQHGGRDELLSAAQRSLDAMALGGIHDHVGGGFHRYSTDGMWAVPHFEKMLYNQAGLLRSYADAAAATGSWWYREVARHLVGFVRRELTDAGTGAFLTALDAETDGREGLYYLWSPEQIGAALGGQAEAFTAAFRLTDVPDHHAARHGAPRSREPQPGVLSLTQQPATPQAAEALGGLCAQLLAARDDRPRPLTDDKVICAWNGLMAGALARAGWLLDEPEWVAMAQRAVTFILANLRDEEGRLQHQWRLGRAKQPAFLDDYAALANTCLDLWLATGDAHWRTEAANLASELTQRFAAADGAFCGADAEATDLLVRSKPMVDNAIPSGNSLAAEVLYRLGRVDEARRTVATLAPLARRYPHGLANLVRVALVHDPAMSAAAGSACRIHAAARLVDDSTAEITVRLTPGYHAEHVSLRTADGDVMDHDASGSSLRITRRRTSEPLDVWLTVQVCGDGVCLPESTLRFRLG